MFIFNGKSLFGNTGLFISILLLIIIVYFSYNKCYIDNYNIDSNSIETFNNPFLPPTDVRIRINNNNVIVNYSLDNYKINALPENFIIILAQYNSNKINTGNNIFYLSNETVLNPSVSTNNSESYTCTINDGVPACQYIFDNVDAKDENKNPYYYKVGISAIYKTGNSPYVTPYNISGDKMFTLVTSLDTQNKIIPTQPVQTISANSISTADGKYELIKSQLGNYPDNLVLDTQTVNNNSLSDLVDKSMAQALLNINVST
jgi:hypothetical protein